MSASGVTKALVHSMDDLHDDFDGAWKEALETYFPAFMEFFAPTAYADIDWTHEFEFLDQELRQVVRDAELGVRRVDKLAKVWRLDGAESWVLAHIEIQSQVDATLAERMYTYNYRIYDRYHRHVSSIVILGDSSPSWRPDHFGYAIWETQVTFHYPVVKLIDYRAQWDKLEASTNPFAIVVMAHLKTQETHGDAPSRGQWKWALTRLLYERGYARKDMLKLFHIINWQMQLPESLKELYWAKIEAYETEHTMDAITYIEQIGYERGEQKGLLLAIKLGLKLRFGAEGLRLYPTVTQIENMERLQLVYDGLDTGATLDDLRSLCAA